MRTILLLLIILPLSLQAQDKITPISEIEIGWEDRYVSIIKDIDLNTSRFLKNKLFADLKIGCSWRSFTLYANTTTYFYPDYASLNFKPTQARYTTGLMYSRKKLQFKYEHMCSHSIDALIFRDGYDRISITYKIF